jgi:hypothetical protein
MFRVQFRPAHIEYIVHSERERERERGLDREREKERERVTCYSLCK